MNIHQKPYHYLISQQEEKILEEIISEITDDNQISFDKESTFDFKKFEILQHYSDIKILSSINFNSRFQILIINIEHHFIGGRHGDSHYIENQILGIKKLERDYGKILIREENIFDKILETLTKTEIDFIDDKEFSNRFFVLADNENNAKRFLDSETRKAIKTISKSENFEIEISNNKLIIRNKKPINKFTFYQILDFLKLSQNKP